MSVGEASVGSFRQLSNQLTVAMQHRQRPAVKTFMVEVLSPVAAEQTAEFLRRSVRRASPRRRVEVFQLADAETIFEVRAGKLTLWVDTGTDRMWEVHSIGDTNMVSALVGRWVATSPALDLPWFPEDLLAQASRAGEFVGFGLLFSREFFVEDPASDVADTLSVRVSGTESRDALHQFRGQDSLTRSSALASVRVRNPLAGPGAMTAGRITSTLSSRGRVSSRGDNFDRHRTYFRHALNLYLGAAASVARAHTVGQLDGTGEGLRGPLVIDLHTPTEDLAAFVGRIFSGAEPFRLWGLLERRAEDLIVADAFDLRTNSPFTVEAMPAQWRVYLPPSTPGALVLKILTLLQRHHDRRVRALGFNPI